MDPSRQVSIKDVMLQGRRFTAGTLPRVIMSSQLATQTGQREKDAVFIFDEKLAVEINLGTAFIGARVKLFALRKQVKNLTNAFSVRMRCFDY